MKNSVIISFFIFWTISTAVITAFLLKNESKAEVSANKNIQVQFQAQDKSGKNLIVADANNQASFNYDSAAQADKILDKEEVSRHNSQSDCWMIINNEIYNFTNYIPMHPGGPGTIISYCGKDATEAFASKGQNSARSHSDYAKSLLKNYYIGKLGDRLSPAASNTKSPSENKISIDRPSQITAKPPQPATTSPAATQPVFQASVLIPPAVNTQSAVVQTEPIPPPTQMQAAVAPSPAAIIPNISMSVIALHNISGDCWTYINNKVYNLTYFINNYSQSAPSIITACGKDGAEAYNYYIQNGGTSLSLSSYFIGNFVL